jgi:hypothetical protein
VIVLPALIVVLVLRQDICDKDFPVELLDGRRRNRVGRSTAGMVGCISFDRLGCGWSAGRYERRIKFRTNPAIHQLRC